jgi:hypothetical protein
MSQIVMSTLGPHVQPAFNCVNLEILVQNEDFVGVFDLIEVWRSRGTAGGPYEELTAESWLPARMPRLGGAPSAVVGPVVDVMGKELEFVLKEKDNVLVVFSSASLTLAAAAAQIRAQSLGRLTSHVDEAAQLVVETLEPGTGAALRVLPGDATSILGLPMQEPDSLVFGRDSRIQLLQDVGTYRFSDISGSTAYFYKTRFRKRSTDVVSEFSLPFGVEQSLGISPANLVCGYLNLATLDGKPQVGREVSLSSSFTGETVEGRLLAGNPLLKRTNYEGHVEFNLVRGQKYSLAVAGLNLAKELVAPVDPDISSFPLACPEAGSQDDYFRARIPDVPVMERRGF